MTFPWRREDIDLTAIDGELRRIATNDQATDRCESENDCGRAKYKESFGREEKESCGRRGEKNERRQKGQRGKEGYLIEYSKIRLMRDVSSCGVEPRHAAA